MCSTRKRHRGTLQLKQLRTPRNHRMMLLAQRPTLAVVIAMCTVLDYQPDTLADKALVAAYAAQ